MPLFLSETTMSLSVTPNVTAPPQIKLEQGLPTVQTPASAPMPSHSLLRGNKMIEIAHNGSLYKLQATKLGKLILTK